MCDCENLNVVLACTTVILLHEQSQKRKTNEEKLTAKKKKHSKSVFGAAMRQRHSQYFNWFSEITY